MRCLLLLLLLHLLSQTQMANFVRAEELLEELRDKSFDAAKVRHRASVQILCRFCTTVEHSIACLVTCSGYVAVKEFLAANLKQPWCAE
jgi:hypothetical protein